MSWVMRLAALLIFSGLHRNGASALLLPQICLTESSKAFIPIAYMCMYHLCEHVEDTCFAVVYEEECVIGKGSPCSYGGKWVHYDLRDEQNGKHVEACQQNGTKQNLYFLSSAVLCDESWIRHHRDSKQHWGNWKHKGLPLRKKWQYYQEKSYWSLTHCMLGSIIL